MRGTKSTTVPISASGTSTGALERIFHGPKNSTTDWLLTQVGIQISTSVAHYSVGHAFFVEKTMT